MEEQNHFELILLSWYDKINHVYFNDFTQDCSNSRAAALELSVTETNVNHFMIFFFKDSYQIDVFIFVSAKLSKCVPMTSDQIYLENTTQWLLIQWCHNISLANKYNNIAEDCIFQSVPELWWLQIKIWQISSYCPVYSKMNPSYGKSLFEAWDENILANKISTAYQNQS